MSREILLALLGVALGLLLLALRGETWLLALVGSADDGRDPDEPSKSARLTTFALLAVVALATLPCLSESTLFDRDEGYYAESARSMLDRGDLFVPNVAGQPWLEKPPLTYWAMMLSMATFGRTTFAARLPSALFGLLLIWATMRLGRRLLGPAGGFVSGLVLASSLLLGLIMQHALLDAALACCVTLSMTGLWHSLSGQPRRGFWMFYVGCGLGVIAKGPLGAALPILSVLGYVVLTRRWRLLIDLAPVRGALVALAVAGIWAVPATVLTHGEYLHELVWVRTIQPVFAPLQGHGGGSALTYFALLPVYLPILLVGLGVWAPFLIPALRDRGRNGMADRRFAFLLGWGGAQLLALSLVSTKLAHYIVPIFPAAALLIAAFVVERLRCDPGGRMLWTRARVNVLVVGGLCVGLLLLAVPVALGFPREMLWFAPAAVVAAATGFVVRHQAARGQPARALVSASTASLLCLALLSILALPRFDGGKSARSIASFLHQRYAGERFAELRIALLDYRQYSVLYYLDRSATRVQSADVDSFLDRDGPAVVVLPENELDAADPRGAPGNHTVIWRKRAWVADKNRWIDTVVVSNGK